VTAVELPDPVCHQLLLSVKHNTSSMPQSLQRAHDNFSVCTNNNNNNNKRICMVPQGRNFRGTGARQCATERREGRKPGRRGMSLA